MNKGYTVTIMKQQIKTNLEESMQGSFFNKALQEIDEVIENMYKGDKITW